MTVGVNLKLDNLKSSKGRILKVTIPVSLLYICYDLYISIVSFVRIQLSMHPMRRNTFSQACKKVLTSVMLCMTAPPKGEPMYICYDLYISIVSFVRIQLSMHPMRRYTFSQVCKKVLASVMLCMTVPQGAPIFIKL